MSKLEAAVEDLASALDGLEKRLERKLRDADLTGDALDAARRQARAARSSADRAARELDASIADLRALLAQMED